MLQKVESFCDSSNNFSYAVLHCRLFSFFLYDLILYCYVMISNFFFNRSLFTLHHASSCYPCISRWISTALRFNHLNLNEKYLLLSFTFIFIYSCTWVMVMCLVKLGNRPRACFPAYHAHITYGKYLTLILCRMRCLSCIFFLLFI